MPTLCVAFNCQNRGVKGSGINFFRFPNNERLKSVWINKIIIRRPNFTWTVNSRLCSAHFEPSEFSKNFALMSQLGYEHARQRLIDGAIPTLFDYSTDKTPKTLNYQAPPKVRGAYLKRGKREVMADPVHTRLVTVKLEPQWDISKEDIDVTSSTAGLYVQPASLSSSSEPTTMVLDSGNYGNKSVYTMKSEVELDKDERDVGEDSQQTNSTQLLPQKMAVIFLSCRKKRKLPQPELPKKFKCNVCNTYYETRSHLEDHKRKGHHPPLMITDFLCSSCNLSFTTEMRLQLHNAVAHRRTAQETVTEHSGKDPDKHAFSDDSNAVPIMDQSDTEQEDTVIHKSSREAPMDLYEPQPLKHYSPNDVQEASIVSGNDSATTHSNEESTTPTLHSASIIGRTITNNQLKDTCVLCGKLFGCKTSFRNHWQSIHGGHDFNDGIEQNGVTTQPSQSGLGASGPSRKEYQCHICVYGTRLKSTFTRHLSRHRHSSHICELCRMPFATAGFLSQHKRAKHAVAIQESKILACEYCPFSSNDPVILKDHIVKNHSCHTLLTLDNTSEPASSKSTKAAGKNMMEFQDDRGMQKIVFTNTIGKKSNSDTSSQGTVEPHKTPVSHSQSTETYGNHPVSLTGIAEERVTVAPTQAGRYARLVSDIDDFAANPFACALCFFRTADVSVLVKHTENHLTGCAIGPIPNTARIHGSESLTNKH